MKLKEVLFTSMLLITAALFFLPTTAEARGNNRNNRNNRNNNWNNGRRRPKKIELKHSGVVKRLGESTEGSLAARHQQAFSQKPTASAPSSDFIMRQIQEKAKKEEEQKKKLQGLEFLDKEDK